MLFIPLKGAFLLNTFLYWLVRWDVTVSLLCPLVCRYLQVLEELMGESSILLQRSHSLKGCYWYAMGGCLWNKLIIIRVHVMGKQYSLLLLGGWNRYGNLLLYYHLVPVALGQGVVLPTLQASLLLAFAYMITTLYLGYH